MEINLKDLNDILIEITKTRTDFVKRRIDARTPAFVEKSLDKLHDLIRKQENVIRPTNNKDDVQICDVLKEINEAYTRAVNTIEKSKERHQGESLIGYLTSLLVDHLDENLNTDDAVKLKTDLEHK